MKHKIHMRIRKPDLDGLTALFKALDEHCYIEWSETENYFNFYGYINDNPETMRAILVKEIENLGHTVLE